MNVKPKISGVLPVLHMPFREDDTIDYDTLANEVDFVIEAGSDGVVLALASELVRLTSDERLELTRRVPEMADGRSTVTISVGAETVKEATRYAAAAEQAGADAVMAIPPITTVLPEQKIFEYYKAIIDVVTIPLVIQDASGYLGHSLSVNIQARLSNELGERIYFKPEAQPIGPTLSALQEALHGRGVIFEGSGGLFLLDSYHRGISGTMPGSDLIRGTVEIWKALESGDSTRAYEVYFPLASIVVLQSVSFDAYVAIEKYLLVKQGIFKNTLLRQPANYEIDPCTAEEVDRLYSFYEAALGS
ncbi:MAG: dihydrodipicolinate synthase family protein [Candidatus Latescibacteria bacterium]|jgi:dihydrodipicolinate synthase/N-acetylneuraminate lyase|nr:dihydrodipicolinate synthase family protein [Candidatus Latescibacterota bacterium]